MDITQDTWIRVIKYWDKKKDNIKPNVWISRQAHLQALDHIRKEINDQNKHLELYETSCSVCQDHNDGLTSITMSCSSNVTKTAEMIYEGYAITEISTILEVETDVILNNYIKEIKKILKNG